MVLSTDDSNGGSLPSTVNFALSKSVGKPEYSIKIRSFSSYKSAVMIKFAIFDDCFAVGHGARELRAN